MALVILKNVEVLDNPAPFLSPLKFDITFECQQALEEDLEWKVIYVGSAEDSKRDQVLDEIMVGPVSMGTMRFTMETDAPDPSKIPQEDLKGVTVVLLQCLYRGNEFVRVGYYVNNEMPEEAAAAAEAAKADPLAHQAQQNQLMQQSASMFRAIVEGGSAVEQHDSLMQTATVAPAPPTIDIPADPTKLVRNILSDKPRVTRFSIDWRPAGAMDAGGDDTMSGLPPMDDVQGAGQDGMEQEEEGVLLAELGAGDTDGEDDNEEESDESDEGNGSGDVDVDLEDDGDNVKDDDDAEMVDG